jgi:hypothetical protein
MAEDDQAPGGLDGLLAEMPRIAEAVNAFTSEAVQQQAFEALLAAHSGSAPAPARRGADVSGGKKQTGTTPKPAAAKAATSNGGKKPKRRTASAPKQVKDLQLSPKGKTSLKDFAAEKKPATNHDRNVLSVYYLFKTADVAPISIDHVYTCYREMSWRVPADLANSLAMTASKKRFLDTADLQDIKLMHRGEEHVELDLPATQKS